MIAELYNEMERDYHLIGATAIEDQLQDNVGETLHALIQAGIKIWMLTGDKMDTAKSIAFSCKLITYEFVVFELKENSNLQEINETLIKSLEKLSEGAQNKYSIIIGMDELDVILKDKSLLDLVNYF
jgi:magnesium-transporting ATPase (P-type)